MGYAIPVPGSNGVAGVGIVKMMGVRRSTRLSRQNVTGINGAHKKVMFSFQPNSRVYELSLINILIMMFG